MKIRVPNLLSGLQGKSQIVQDELVGLGEQIVQSAEGTRAVALELCHDLKISFYNTLQLGSGWKIVASFEGTFPNKIKQLPLDRHFDINNVKRVHCVLVNKVSASANATSGLGRHPLFKKEALSCLPNHVDSGVSFINHFNKLKCRKGFHNTLRSYITIPGSEIPKWFNFQSNESLVKLPQFSLNHIMGSAFCVVLEFQNYHFEKRPLNVEYELHVICQDGWKQVAFGFFGVLDKHCRSNHIESDNLYMGYENIVYNYNYIYREAIMIFKATHDLWHNVTSEYCKIKKCLIMGGEGSGRIQIQETLHL